MVSTLRISITDSRVRTALHVSIIDSESDRANHAATKKVNYLGLTTSEA